MAGRTNNELLAQLVKDVGDIKGQQGKLIEKTEENSRKLDDVHGTLKAHDGRLRKVERVADRGTGALKGVLWIGGGITAATTAVMTVAKALGWTGKGGG